MRGGSLKIMNPDAARDLLSRMGQPIPDWLKEAKASKLRNVKKEIGGIVFDSTLEARAYQILKLWEKAGRISALTLQPRYLLQPGLRCRDGKSVRPIYYQPDFQFFDEQEKRDRVVDAKGYQTAVFRLKAKMFAERYPLLQLELWTKDQVKEMERC